MNAVNVNTMNEAKVYTLREIAEQYKVTRRALYNWVKSGKLQAIKLGSEWRVTQEALDSFTRAGTRS